MRSLSLISVLAFSVAAGPSSAAGDAKWTEATDCFNAGDFDCAFSKSVDLFRAGKVTVGNGEGISDSMTFYQMSYVEAASRASTEKLQHMAKTVITDFARQPNRLPFVYGFNLLALADRCVQSDECQEDFEELFCRVSNETPKPEWRALTDIDSMSETGKNYFERLWSERPDCVGV